MFAVFRKREFRDAEIDRIIFSVSIPFSKVFNDGYHLGDMFCCSGQVIGFSSAVVPSSIKAEM